MAGVETGSERFVVPHLRGRVRQFEAGDPPPGVLRLDLNEAPYGPTRSAAAVLRAPAELNRYPDASTTRLRARLGRRHDLPPEMVLPGPGSNSLASLLVRLCAAPGARVAYSWPGFPTYAGAALRAEAEPVPVPLRDDDHDDLDALLAAAEDAAVLFLATPANPTGRAVGAELEDFVRAAAAHTLVVVDEAYAEYAPPGTPSAVDLVREGLDIVVLRTFSKVWGLAGLRVGYALLPAELARHARALQDTFEIATPSQLAACAALDDEDEMRARVAENARVRTAIERRLAERDVPFVPSTTNFVLVRPPDPAGFVTRSEAAGVLFRRMTAYGDPTAVRVGVPGEADLPRTLAALAAALG